MGLEAEKKSERYLNENYQILSRLGEGGDGTVYLVRHIPTDQLRAAKTLKRDFQGERMHELNMMKKLHHPSLPQIMDVLDADGQIWMVMEYIQGSCLIRDGTESVTAEQFFSVARQLSEVVFYLHNRAVPILHLDIKPSNVLMERSGRLVLIDFGASVLSAPGERAVFGTPGFAAPEQQVPGGVVDIQSDIYGCGALLYYYLYGCPPGTYNRKKQLRQSRISWEKYAIKLINRCLQKEKSRRYADSKSLCRAVLKMEKEYLRKKYWKKVTGAAGLLGLILVFAVFNLRGETLENRAATEKEEYERLLQMSEKMGFSQALSCYEAAVRLCPADSGWCFHLLERIGVDYFFSLDEEEALKKLIFAIVPEENRTVIELLERDSDSYGEAAYRIGLAYWYYFEGSGGKSAASKWFERAVSSQNEQYPKAGWLASARIHADIGRYYEKLGKRDEDGKNQAEFWSYWMDLKRLWRLENISTESIGIRRQVANELLSCLIMRGYELQQAGETREEMEAVLESIEHFVKTEESEKEFKAAEEEQCRAAAAAVERVFAKEGGNEIDKENEET